MVIYLASPIYQGGLDPCAMVTFYETVIMQLNDAAMQAALNGDTVMYSLDTGQSKQTKTFRSAEDVSYAITALERLRQMWINRINGRMMRRVPKENFIYPQYGNGYI